MIRRTGARGRPLLLFGAVLTGWLAFRIALWDTPFAQRLEPSAPNARLAEVAAMRVRSVRKEQAGTAHVRPALGHFGPADAFFGPRPAVAPVGAVPPAGTPYPPVSRPETFVDKPQAPVAHARPPIEGLARRQVPAAQPAYRPAPPRQWSADGWLLLRREGAAGMAGPVLPDRPSYGRSQVGAVIRYALAPGHPLRPRIHVRAASALSGSRERELAGGLSLRPLPRAPLRMVAEARAVESGAGRYFRPAVYAVTELPPVALPRGLRAEAYAQGGYVGGDFATAFIDGQARAEGLLARVGKGRLSAGAGVWGGAQKASSRLDVGPTAAVTFQIGETRGRLAADYRFRVAGGARPASGPALTLSAGF